MRFDQHMFFSGVGDVFGIADFANIAPQKRSGQGGFADIGVSD